MKERSLSRSAVCQGAPKAPLAFFRAPDDGEISTDGRANLGPRLTENRAGLSRPAGGRPEGKP
jgi:hypothetical protein